MKRLETKTESRGLIDSRVPLQAWVCAEKLRLGFTPLLGCFCVWQFMLFFQSIEQWQMLNRLMTRGLRHTDPKYHIYIYKYICWWSVRLFKYHQVAQLWLWNVPMHWPCFLTVIHKDDDYWQWLIAACRCCSKRACTRQKQKSGFSRSTRTCKLS